MSFDSLLDGFLTTYLLVSLAYVVIAFGAHAYHWSTRYALSAARAPRSADKVIDGLTAALTAASDQADTILSNPLYEETPTPTPLISPDPKASFICTVASVSLSAFNIRQLRAIAIAAGLKGYTGMKVGELREALSTGYSSKELETAINTAKAAKADLFTVRKTKVSRLKKAS